MTPKIGVGRYRRVDPRIWQDLAFQSLSALAPSGQALYLFLLTCREGHMLPGVVMLGVAAMAEILEWPVEATRLAIAELVEARLIRVDTKARVLYICGGVEANPPANPNVITSWATSWHEVAECELKWVIWAVLASAIKPRGDEFWTAFLTACPNGSRNRSGNRIGNKEPEPEPDHVLEQETDPDQDPGGAQVPGEVHAGIPFGEESLRETDGSVPGAGPGLGPDLSDAPEFMEDWDDLPATGPKVPEVSAEAQALVDDWNTKVATTGSVFERVEAKDVVKLAPAISRALQVPGAAKGFKDLFTLIPLDNWYQGQNATKFVAFLAHYVKLDPDRLQGVFEVARKKLAKLTRSPSTKKTRAESEAKAARDQQRSGPSHTISGNHLDEILRS